MTLSGNMKQERNNLYEKIHHRTTINIWKNQFDSIRLRPGTHRHLCPRDLPSPDPISQHLEHVTDLNNRRNHQLHEVDSEIPREKPTKAPRRRFHDHLNHRVIESTTRGFFCEKRACSKPSFFYFG